MRFVPWLLLAVGLFVGCGQRGGMEAGGLVFDRSQFEESPAPEKGGPTGRDDDLWRQGESRTERRSDAGSDSRRDSFRNDPSWWPDGSRSRGSRTVGSDEEQAVAPSDSLPSRTGRWGQERSMPSDSMPSRTEKWGKNREMPSDAMPSRREAWGSDRKMPSDSMPSRTFPRRTNPTEDLDE